MLRRLQDLNLACLDKMPSHYHSATTSGQSFLNYNRLKNVHCCWWDSDICRLKNHLTNWASSTFAISNHFFLHPPHIWQTLIFGWDVPPRRFSKGNVCSATSTFSDLSLFAAKFSSTMQKSSTVLCKRLLAKKTFNVLMPFSTSDHLWLKLWLKFWLVLEPIKFLQPHFLNATFENVISSNPRRVAEFARRKKTFGALDF